MCFSMVQLFLCQETVKPRERSPSCFRVSRCRGLVTGLQMAGGDGFEPPNAGIKIQCLTKLGEPPTLAPLPGIEPGTNRLTVCYYYR